MFRSALVVLALPLVGCSAPEPAASARGAGEVRATTVVDFLGPGVDLTTIEAHFSRPGAGPPCRERAFGSCKLTGCNDESSQPQASPNAGLLTVETADGRFVQRLLPDPTGAYAFGDEYGVFADTDLVGVSAEGGDVPAFDGAVRFPSPLVVVAPLPEGTDTAVVVPRGSDVTLDVAWPDGDPALSFAARLAGPSGALVCSTSSRAGSLVIPAAAIDEVAPGTIDLFTERRVVVRVGAYDVALLAVAAAFSESGQRLSLTLE